MKKSELKQIIREEIQKLLENKDNIDDKLLKSILSKLKFEYGPEDAHIDGNYIFVPFDSTGMHNSYYLKDVRATFENSLKMQLRKKGFSSKDYNIILDTNKKHPYLSGWYFNIKNK